MLAGDGAGRRRGSPRHVGEAESRGPDPGGGERSAAHPAPVSGRGGRGGGSRPLGLRGAAGLGPPGGPDRAAGGRPANRGRGSVGCV